MTGRLLTAKLHTVHGDICDILGRVGACPGCQHEGHCGEQDSVLLLHTSTDHRGGGRLAVGSGDARNLAPGWRDRGRAEKAGRAGSSTRLGERIASRMRPQTKRLRCRHHSSVSSRAKHDKRRTETETEFVDVRQRDIMAQCRDAYTMQRAGYRLVVIAPPGGRCQYDAPAHGLDLQTRIGRRPGGHTTERKRIWGCRIPATRVACEMLVHQTSKRNDVPKSSELTRPPAWFGMRVRAWAGRPCRTASDLTTTFPRPKTSCRGFKASRIDERLQYRVEALQATRKPDPCEFSLSAIACRGRAPRECQCKDDADIAGEARGPWTLSAARAGFMPRK